MHLRVVTKRRGDHIYRSAQIVERVYVDGRARNNIIKHLGPVKDEKDLEQYRKIFAIEKRRKDIEHADLRGLTILPARSFGMIYASRVLIHDLGLDPVFDILGDHSDILLLSVISRLTDPGSDLDLLRYLDGVYFTGIGQIKKDQVYSMLDDLIEKKDRIEQAIISALKPDMRRVYYDLTSTYFEGKEKNDLVLFGYSRDKKRGKKQINIGLMMADGIPIHHEVFPGNTVDPKTLRKIHGDLRKRFHTGRVIFIGDRAFGRKPSLQYLDKNEYITAVYRWDQPYRSILTNAEFNETDHLNDLDLYAMEVDVKWNVKGLSRSEIKRSRNRRAIAVYGPDREREDIADIEEKVSIVKSIISSGRKGSDLNDALGKLRSYTKSNGTELNEERISDMKKLAGRFMIVSDTDLHIVDIVKGYKDLWKIERSFRTIKSFLEIRPVNHRKEERIEAHVFVCVLSLLMARLFEKAMSDEMTISRISSILEELQAIPLKIDEGTIIRSTESGRARSLLEKLKIPYPGKVIDTLTN